MSAVTPIYGRTSDGLLAARLADLTYIAIPNKDRARIASGWRLGKPIDELCAGDVHGSEGEVQDEVGFRAFVDAIALHLTQRAALGRKEVRMAMVTPWGASQGATVYGEGVVAHGTAGHGGFKLDRKRNAAMPSALRNAGGWYEEDAEWAKVAIAFPDLFTDREREMAERTLRLGDPDAWEAVFGRRLEPHESFMRERQHFEREHAGEWVVISALRSDRWPGQVEAIATIGGRRDGHGERAFLVPCGEYSAGRHGFVIDLARHQPMPAG